MVTVVLHHSSPSVCATKPTSALGETDTVIIRPAVPPLPSQSSLTHGGLNGGDCNEPRMPRGQTRSGLRSWKEREKAALVALQSLVAAVRRGASALLLNASASSAGHEVLNSFTLRETFLLAAESVWKL